MANELSVYYPTTGETIYFVITQAGNKVWNGSAMVTGVAANQPAYAITSADAANRGIYEGTFPPAIPAGTAVTVYAYKQAGGSPASTDPVIGLQGPLTWNGSILANPSDVTSSNGVTVSAKNGNIVSATATGVVLSATDPLVIATANLQGFTIRFLGRSTYGLITDTGTTATRVVSGGWQNGPTPPANAPYELVLPAAGGGGSGVSLGQLNTALGSGVVTLAPTGLDAIPTTPPALGVAPNFRHMMVMTYRRWFKKHVAVGSTLTGYADDDTTPLTVQAIPPVTSPQTQGKAV